MGMFQALWGLNFRSFNHLNGPVMVLLHKTQSPAGLKDYGPISLIHSVGKAILKINQSLSNLSAFRSVFLS